MLLEGILKRKVYKAFVLILFCLLITGCVRTSEDDQLFIFNTEVNSVSLCPANYWCYDFGEVNESGKILYLNYTQANSTNQTLYIEGFY